ncbi:carbohydrate-binding protein [Streptomyces hirsutus]|uniref:carbohydrate-binding protein n=1 Tax=Streptomyces TaxID=1883 RepID=UPI00386CEC97|nr:carbohydrate-binding protein [Streptomyces hirsutus]WTD75866.1 carbohydrate-binding protein [Streptomyces sp. NBC_01635]
MTPGSNGASTPEDDDPFGYLYADGQANGAQPPSGGYGYPNSVNRVRPVGTRQYGQQGPAAQAPQQQKTHGQSNANYAAPETLPGAAPTASSQLPGNRGGHGGGGRGRGPNTKGLLIGAVAVLAAVVIGISVAMLSGDDDKNDKSDNQADASPTQGQTTTEPSPSASGGDGEEEAVELPTIDAKALRLDGGATLTSDIKGAKADGGVYVTGFNNVGAKVTWSVDGIKKAGKYSVYVGYSVPGKDGTASLTVNGKRSTVPVGLKNWAKAPEGDYEKGWTKTYNWVELNKGTNIIELSCEQGNQCDVLIDQMWLTSGWQNQGD